jgi:hypothetical protein
MAAAVLASVAVMVTERRPRNGSGSDGDLRRALEDLVRGVGSEASS